MTIYIHSHHSSVRNCAGKVPEAADIVGMYYLGCGQQDEFGGREQRYKALRVIPLHS